jgi:hypothetical protein
LSEDEIEEDDGEMETEPSEIQNCQVIRIGLSFNWNDDGHGSNNSKRMW